MGRGDQYQPGRGLTPPRPLPQLGPPGLQEMWRFPIQEPLNELIHRGDQQRGLMRGPRHPLQGVGDGRFDQGQIETTLAIAPALARIAGDLIQIRASTGELAVPCRQQGITAQVFVEDC